MAKCVRKTCKLPVSSVPEAKQKRLCEKHYQRFCELTLRKEKNLIYQINKKLPRCIKRPKKRRGCYSRPPVISKYIPRKSAVENAGFKKEAWIKIKSILKTPAWRNVETNVRRNRNKEELLLTLEDITDIYWLYSWVDFCKKDKKYSIHYLNVFDVNIRLQICKFPDEDEKHAAPMKNLIALPLVLKNKVINLTHFKKKTVKENKKNKFLSLYKTLIKQFGVVNTTSMFVSLPDIFPVHPYQFKTNICIFPLKRTPPLFCLLFNEFKRLGMTGFFCNLEVIYNKNIDRPFSLEMLALYIFYNLLRGGVQEIKYCMADKVDDNGLFYSNVIFSFIKSELRLKDEQGLINLYNSFFTRAVVNYDANKKCVVWGNGRKEVLSMRDEAS
ncbi:hypothetical protein GTE46_005591 [Salmonella enterica subsp. enterica]|nr:hypothetical protein [Salmonella enterica subsp. enterica]EDY2804028.1 hypothetical protein [Salmonella enterica subsp. enterica]